MFRYEKVSLFLMEYIDLFHFFFNILNNDAGSATGY